jgi:hypothetical protein
MDSWQKDMKHFVEWMLLGEVVRTPSGKRQRQPMVGQWISYGRGKGMRGSDLRNRRFLCIEALTKIGGHSISYAAATVAHTAIPKSPIDVIRVGYYEVKDRKPLDELGLWLRCYLDWRNWVLYSPEATLRFELTRYRESYGQMRRRRLQTLMERIRDQAGGQLIEAARMCNRIGPLALSFLDDDIASLREHAGELVERISDARARFQLQPQTGTDACEHTV